MSLPPAKPVMQKFWCWFDESLGDFFVLEHEGMTMTLKAALASEEIKPLAVLAINRDSASEQASKMWKEKVQPCVNENVTPSPKFAR